MSGRSGKRINNIKTKNNSKKTKGAAAAAASMRTYIPSCPLRAPVDEPIQPVRTSTSHAFNVTDADHCETPLSALRDVAWLLDTYASAIGKSKKTLQLYDPFYCEGGIVRHWKQLGFPCVYHRNEDFYTALKPDYDILVTNPPYSGNHMQRITEFCVASGKPWLLLVPNFVYKKQYFVASTSNEATSLLFIVPKSRYGYRSPGSGKHTAPFLTFWHCGGLCNIYSAILDAWTQLPSKRKDHLHLAKGCSNIPSHAVPVRVDQTGAILKRPGPKARKRLAKKIKNGD